MRLCATRWCSGVCSGQARVIRLGVNGGSSRLHSQAVSLSTDRRLWVAVNASNQLALLSAALCTRESSTGVQSEREEKEPPRIDVRPYGQKAPQVELDLPRTTKRERRLEQHYNDMLETYGRSGSHAIWEGGPNPDLIKQKFLA